MTKKSALLLLLSALIVFGGLEITLTSISQAQTKEELNVKAEFWRTQKQKAIAPRKAPTGINPKGLVVPKELKPDGVTKQKAKLAEMIADGYQQPLDYPDLAAKVLAGVLIELPMATESYVLDVGGSADDAEFTSFDFEEGSTVLNSDSPKYATLKKLADNFNGVKYDLGKPSDRKQFKIRLLRTINPRAKVVLVEIAAAYFKKFSRPLIINSMIHSMEYQVELNQTNPNSFLVRGKGSLPPHTSGCAFDLARKHLTAEEQNFVMSKLAEMEKADRMDALIEYGVNAVFHVFVYHDGIPPKTQPDDK